MKKYAIRKFHTENAIGLAGAVVLLFSLMYATSVTVTSAPLGI